MPETLRGGEASSNDGGGFQERAAGMVHNVRKWWMANNINAVGRPRGRIHFWAGIDCGQAGNVALNVISQVTLEGNLSSSPSDFTAAVFCISYPTRSRKDRCGPFFALPGVSLRRVLPLSFGAPTKIFVNCCHGCSGAKDQFFSAFRPIDATEERLSLCSKRQNDRRLAGSPPNLINF
jgi:hypothetical protein